MAPRIRCPWAGDDPLMVRYHDTEWGVPVHDDRRLFEFLVLAHMQAVGMVNDHLVPCFRHAACARRGRRAQA